MVDLLSPGHLPHIFERDLDAERLAIRQEATVKVHIDLKQLLGNAVLAVREVLHGVDDDMRRAEHGGAFHTPHDILENERVFCFVGDARRVRAVRLIEDDALAFGKRAKVF